MRRRLRSLIGRWWPLAVAGGILLDGYGLTRLGHDLTTVGGWARHALANGWRPLVAGLLLAWFLRDPLLSWFLRAPAKRTLGLVRRVSRLVIVVALALAALAMLALAFIAVPVWFVPDDAPDLYTARNAVRTTAVQAVAGLVVLLGAYFTWRQLHTIREGQVTERFTRAIDHLGSDQLDVRLGGIYALERIARDSPPDRTTISEVLTAYIRTHSPWPPRLPGQGRADLALDQVRQLPALRTRLPDVQAALTVLGRGRFAMPTTPFTARLDLHATDLRSADLVGAYLVGANLAGAHLEKADLASAHLGTANLHSAHLEGANLAGAYLVGANLHSAHLEGADLMVANLKRAHLAGAHLVGANLTVVNLEGTYLYDAHLEGTALFNVRLKGANLDGAHLDGAIASPSTTWPKGFDWQARGVHVLGAGEPTPNTIGPIDTTESPESASTIAADQSTADPPAPAGSP